MRYVAMCILVLAAGFAGGVLATTDWSGALATSPLELIPHGDRSTELAALRQLAGDTHARSLLAVVESPSGRAGEAAEAARAALVADATVPGIACVNPRDMAARRESGRVLFERRFALLFPRWLAEARAARGAEAGPAALAEHACARLDAFLQTDAAYAFEKLVPADPLLLVPDATLPLLKEAGGKAEPTRAQLWIDAGRSPLRAEGQGPVFAAIGRAEAAMRARVPDATLRYTGVAVFAAASEAGIKGELSLLNTLSLAGVALICAVMLRRVAIIPHIAVVVGLSIGCSWAVTLLAFGRIHVFAVVLGALLAGVCVDFVLYVMLHDGEDGRPASFDRLRPLLRPLVGGGLVAGLAFAALMFSPLPAIRQTGVFAMTGILSALVLAVAYGSVVRFRPRATRAAVAPAAGPGRWRWAAAGLLAAAAGLGSVRWNDSLRDLEYPLPEIRRVDREIRGAFGEASRSGWLVCGRTNGEAQEALRALVAHGAAATGRADAVRSPLLALATPAEHAAAAAFLQGHGAAFETAFAAALAAHGYEREAFAGFFTAFAAAREAFPPHETSVEAFLASLSGPESMLVSRGGPWRLFVAWTDAGAPVGDAPAGVAAFPLNRLESLNRALGAYRENLMALALAGLAATVVANVAVQRRAAAARAFVAPGLCAGAVLGAMGWLGVPLSMFHLTGAFLALCCSLNYGVFAQEARAAGKPFPVAVTLAWATTAVSFGALGFSSIPAAFALGATVVPIITLAWALARFAR